MLNSVILLLDIKKGKYHVLLGTPETLSSRRLTDELWSKDSFKKIVKLLVIDEVSL